MDPVPPFAIGSVPVTPDAKLLAGRDVQDPNPLASDVNTFPTAGAPPDNLNPTDSTVPVAVIFPVFANVIFVVVPKLPFPSLILIPAPKRKVAAPSLLSTISPSSDKIIP